MSVKIIERQPKTIACLRHTGPYGEAVTRFWLQVFYPWVVAQGLLGKPRYGIGHDDADVTIPEQCRYDAGVEVPADFVVTGQAFKTVIPGGKYAVYRFTGTAAEVGAAWTDMLHGWLPGSGFRIDGQPCFELYSPDATYDPATGIFECDICIPVLPL